jgi:hypothetical protein
MKKVEMEVTVSFPEEVDLPDQGIANPIVVPPLDFGRIIRHTWYEGELYLQVQESPRNVEATLAGRSTILLCFNLPWACGENDTVRQALSAYLICIRMKTQGRLGNCTFQTSAIKGSIFAFRNRKKARSLRVINSDLINEILLTDGNVSIPIIETEYEAFDTRSPYQLDAPRLRFISFPSTFTVTEGRKIAARKIFEEYLRAREEKSSHEIPWTQMDWETLALAWVTSSTASLIHIRQLRILLEHEPCGEIAQERNYDPLMWYASDRDDQLAEVRNLPDPSSVLIPEYEDEEIVMDEYPMKKKKTLTIFPLHFIASTAMNSRQLNTGL